LLPLIPVRSRGHKYARQSVEKDLVRLAGRVHFCSKFRAKKFVLFNDCGSSNACAGPRAFNAHHACGETHAHRVRQRNVRREGQSHFELVARCQRAIEIEKNAASANVLRLGQGFDAGKHNGGGQAHVEAPHQSPVLLR